MEKLTERIYKSMLNREYIHAVDSCKIEEIINEILPLTIGKKSVADRWTEAKQRVENALWGDSNNSVWIKGLTSEETAIFEEYGLSTEVSEEQKAINRKLWINKTTN